ncbi:hypothetical protein NDU88_003205 [Pleurodeles waltl]|uniref:Uncharacterized protein n=1 Tax=Pleurodeles waltl TaxID=8319 RepID=A0AAV7LRF0_PLEWA|nr:hypothetical protein NDU88_003205 [Pleurodeles waltl]
MSRRDRLERKPPGSGCRADPKERKDQGGEESTVVWSSWERTRLDPRSPHSPNPGRRLLAPGSIRLGPATLQ